MFVNQDSIGLMGGTNFYQFSMNALGGVDPLGLARNIHQINHQIKSEKKDEY
ncbi:MAG: hypothetical protein KH109_04060 [Veillonella sp.]|nr:hypothetical protein [Veillonella sp.]